MLCRIQEGEDDIFSKWQTSARVQREADLDICLTRPIDM